MDLSGNHSRSKASYTINSQNFWSGSKKVGPRFPHAAQELGNLLLSQLEVARFKIFQARSTRSPQHPPVDRGHFSFSIQPAGGPLNNYQCLFWLLRQNVYWGYFAFSGTRLVELFTWQAQYAKWLAWISSPIKDLVGLQVSVFQLYSKCSKTKTLDRKGSQLCLAQMVVFPLETTLLLFWNRIFIVIWGISSPRYFAMCFTSL